MLKFLLPALLVASVAVAQVQFTASASRTSVPAGETFEVTFTIAGAATGVSTPKPVDYQNVDLIGGPATSTQTSIINGSVSSQKSFTYVFRAKEPGPATIGPVQAAIKGKAYLTSPIQIVVTSAGRSVGGGQRDEVFVQVIPDQREAFVGEQIVLTYKLFFSTSVYAPEFKEMPMSTGFWTEEFEMPSQLVPRDEVVEGQSYKSVVIRKVALFATTAGELTVDPLTAVVQVERRQDSRGRRNDPFNDPFFNFGRRREAVEVSCRPLKLNIKALPEVGKPAGDIAVGNYSISARLDKTVCEINDAVTLTVLVRGSGNIKTLPKPAFNIPADFEAFDPKTTDQVKRGPDKISGSKSFEYVLIPRAPGAQTIPEISFSYFDPVKLSYEVARTSPLSINVQRGSGRASESSGLVASKREVQTIGQDIAYVKNSLGELTSAQSLPHQTVGFWFGLSAPWLVLAGVLFSAKRQAQAGQTVSARRRRIIKKVRLELSQAERANADSNTDIVTRSFLTVVQSIAAEFTQIPPGTATMQDWEAEWRSRGHSLVHWDTLVSANQLSERSRFAGSAISKPEIAEIIANLRTMLSEMEGAAK